MNYAETINYLFTKLPMFSRMGSAAFKKDLTNTIALCKSLDNPHTQFKTIHVGGTNGKGSVSHMLAAILQTAGYKTGLYTSPHLYDFRERIKVNGKMVTEDFVIHFTNKIKPVIEKIEPSFFEITVAMAFDYFSREKVDIAIIEVGLGGRLDSTNIIVPELSVITNIGWDHMNLLGDNLPDIAREKGGIIKANTPVVIGERNEETDPVFTSIAGEKSVPIFYASDKYAIDNYQIKAGALEVSVKRHTDSFQQKFELDLTGFYQLKNLCTVLQSVDVLIANGWSVTEREVAQALPQTKKLTGLHGRWEMIQNKPPIILEVAHNVNGIEQMIKHLSQLQYRQLHLVFGMVKDKDLNSILSLLPKEAHYYFTQALIHRALPAADLRQQANFFGLLGNEYSGVNEALSAAQENAADEDLIIVCGSIFLVAEVDRKRIQN